MKTIIRDKTRIDNNTELRYLLFEESEGGRKFYSYCIESHNDANDIFAEASDVCDTEDEAVVLFERLYGECVLPETLAEVAEDYIFDKTYLSPGTAITPKTA